MDPLQVNQCSDWLCQGDIKNYIQHNKKNVTLIREIFHQNWKDGFFFQGTFCIIGENWQLFGEKQKYFLLRNAFPFKKKKNKKTSSLVYRFSQVCELQ